MKIQAIVFLIILSWCFINGNCNKTKDIGNNTNVNLRDKTLSEIKATVQGNWKIHYRYGGLTGNVKTPMTDSYYKVLPSDSIYLTLSNVLYASDKANFQRITTIFGYSAYTMDFISISGTPKSWIVDYINGDTLVLDDNNMNGSAYHMTKFP